MKSLKFFILIFLAFALASCAKRNPEPISTNDTIKVVEDDLAKIEKIKEENELFNKDLKVDLYTAIALAIENNKDLKVKLLETSVANQRIEDVEFEMLPKMAANAGYTGSERYKATTSSTVPSSDLAGSLGSSYSTSRNRDVLEQDIGFTWNALDFGLSYIRAGQSSDRYLISKEMEKKAANNIARDVISAYWNALSAQKLLKKYDPLLVKVNKALNDSEKIQELLLQRPMDALLYQKELLDIQRALQSQKQSFVNARIELGTLMGLLPNEKFTLIETDQPLNELDMKLSHMEKHALVNRPELVENHYEERISIAETKAGMRSLLPGLNFNTTWTSSNNDYLLNKGNFEYGSSIGANLLNVFRAPTINKVNELNTEVIKEQRLALSMAVLSQVHISNINYQMATEEYETSDRYYEVSRKITDQVRNAQKIARFGELELIREEASLLVAELRKDIAFSKLQFAIAQIYTSVGIDVTSKDAQMGTKSFASLIKSRFKDSGKKYRAIVKKPINKQKPLAKSVNENTNEFQFSDKTFELEGKGRIQYAATLQDNSPLPNWIRFLPSQRTFLIDTKTKGNIEEINLTVSAKNINAVTEDNFTLVVDPELRSQRLAKEKRIEEEKKLAEKRKKEEEKRLKAQKLKEEKERKKAEAKRLKEEKLAKLKAEKEALENKTFDLTAKATDKDGNIFTTLDADEKAKLIKAQEKKNKKLRKQLLKAEKKANKKKKKLASKNIKQEAKTKKVEEAVELNIADITEKTIYSDAPEELANVYIRSLEKDGGIYKLYSDEEIQKFIKTQEKQNVKLRKKLEKIKKKEAKQKAKKLKISKLN